MKKEKYMRTKKVETIQEKLKRLKNQMIAALISGLILIILCSQMMVALQNNNMGNFQVFSQYINTLEQSEQILYLYAQVPENETKTECESILVRLDETITVLAENLPDIKLRQLRRITQYYTSQSRKVLSTDRDGVLTEELLEKYQEAKEIKELIISLLDNYYDDVSRNVSDRNDGLRSINNIITLLLIGMSLFIIWNFTVNTKKLSKDISQPLQRLTRQAQEIVFGETQLEEKEKQENINEMEVLTTAFYEMVDRNDQYLRKIRETMEVEKRLAEEKVESANLKARLNQVNLKMLQARVNPHFMFNTLNILAGLAIDENAERTTEAVLKMAEYLRYSLEYLDKKVRIADEFQNAENYLEIQKLRFEDRIRTDIQLDEKSKDVQICSMVLQPLCENALVHGIIPRLEGGHIGIRAEYRGETVRLTVADDGLGMSAEQLAAVKKRIAEYKEYDDSNGIGLVNIYHRLVLFYEKEIVFEIESEEGSGTVIRLEVPCVPQEV